VIVILMGVTGSGKTTVAKALVERTGWAFAEGDDFHSEANKAKMHAGHPLTDADRQPWLETLNHVLQQWAAAGQNGVMSCSALKENYRQTLVTGLRKGVAHFVLLEAPEPVLRERLERRAGHFMNPALLDSQFATLEVPADAIHVLATSAPAQAVDQIMDKLQITGQG
jgi:gluconokinase